MQQIEKKRERKIQFEQQLKECDTVMRTKEKLAELRDLCQHYGMQDFVKDKIKLTDRQLLDQFTNGVGNSFHAYKKNSSINRTFVNCNFKDKPSKVDDERVKKIIEE
jgi:hypothetical protein